MLNIQCASKWPMPQMADRLKKWRGHVECVSQALPWNLASQRRNVWCSKSLDAVALKNCSILNNFCSCTLCRTESPQLIVDFLFCTKCSCKNCSILNNFSVLRHPGFLSIKHFFFEMLDSMAVPGWHTLHVLFISSACLPFVALATCWHTVCWALMSTHRRIQICSI